MCKEQHCFHFSWPLPFLSTCAPGTRKFCTTTRPSHIYFIKSVERFVELSTPPPSKICQIALLFTHFWFQKCPGACTDPLRRYVTLNLRSPHFLNRPYVLKWWIVGPRVWKTIKKVKTLTQINNSTITKTAFPKVAISCRMSNWRWSAIGVLIKVAMLSLDNGYRDWWTRHQCVGLYTSPTRQHNTKQNRTMVQIQRLKTGVQFYKNWKLSNNKM